MDDTAPDYRTAALITIDVQMDTLDGQPLEVPGTSAVLPTIGRLCEGFRQVGSPIVHMLRLYAADGSNAERARRDLVRQRPVLRPGTPGRALAPEILSSSAPTLDDQLLLSRRVQPLGPKEVAVYKPRWGAFYQSALEEHLGSLGTTTLVFAGCNFPNCPRTSIYEASERDYRIVLAEDAISGLYQRGHDEIVDIGVHCAPASVIVEHLRAAVSALSSLERR